MESIEKKLRKLPPGFKNEVEDFISFLFEKAKRKSFRKPKLNWIGGLKELRDKYNSVELQHKISQWRIKKEPAEVIQ